MFGRSLKMGVGIEALVFGLGILGSLTSAYAGEVSDEEIAIHIHHESGGKDDAVGDKNLDNWAYGPLQIRQPVITDVNRRYGTKYRPEQMLGNRALSIEVAKKYWAIYATRKALGHEPTSVDRAGIWNGGPHGWKRSVTAGYRRDFTAMEKCQRASRPLKEWKAYKEKSKPAPKPVKKTKKRK
jgi:hypothetical protein